jgi:nicotinamide-nucleotide amidase
MDMQAIILSIGDELALGQTVDTNAAWLSARLIEHGIPTLMHLTVADDLDAIGRAIRSACDQSDLVIITGGLGPTEDDLTREALASAMDVELVQDGESLSRIKQFFEQRGRVMPERNGVQAMHPQGSRMLTNPRGTAPGIAARLGDAKIFVTPGVPHEMNGMFSETILPQLLQGGSSGRVIRTAKVNTFGIGESDAAEKLADLTDRHANPTVGTTVSDGLCSIRIRSEAKDATEADAMLQTAIEQVEDRLGSIAFGREEDTLEQSVISLCIERQQTVATAESCTGGLLGAMLTSVAGSSAAYLGGWVTYHNAMKQQQLGVADATLEQHGAVSEAVVLAMAASARQRSGADYALSISGVAGPGGGTENKPVGTVWIGLATPETTLARQARFSGPRQSVRDRAAKCALQMLRLTLLEEPLELIQWLAVEPATA